MVPGIAEGPAPCDWAGAAQCRDFDASGFGMVAHQVEVYEMWCQWLDLDANNIPLPQVVQMLSQGGEVLRSFVQFLARTVEPHLTGTSLPSSPGCGVEAATWRSCVAMQISCHMFTGSCGSTSLEGPEVRGMLCYELLAGLQPRSRACSMHICTVLQHLLSAHDREVCRLMLQYHAPFVLLRSLNQPGCPELLLALLLGCDALLPGLLPKSLRPLGGHQVQQVLQYLRATHFPGLVAALLEQGVQLGTGASGRQGTRCGAACPGSCTPPARASGLCSSPVVLTPARRSSWPSPGTPGWPSPGRCGTTPQMLPTPFSTPRSTPKPPGTGKTEASPLCTLPAPPSSPSPSQPQGLSFLDLPVFPVERPPNRQLASGRGGTSPSPERAVVAPRTPCRVPRTPGHGCPGPSGLAASTPRPDSRNLSPGRDSGSPGESDDEANRRGIGVLIEFLACILDACRRASEAVRRSRQQPGEEGIELLVEVRWQLLEAIFIDTPLVSHLFRLLRNGAAQFESAKLLHSLLQHALNPRGSRGKLAESVVSQYLPHVDTLGSLLLRNAPKTARDPRRPLEPQRRLGRELRLNAYTVLEPLGTLRVVAVQILSALGDLAPERALSLVKPAVWGLLVQWFLLHRCNHIFQAACGRLWIAVVNHGGTRVQHLAFVKLRLFSGLCDAVLAEGACGDRWHEVRSVRGGDLAGTEPAGAGARAEKAQVSVCRNRHPGGLGGFVPVLTALASRGGGGSQNQAPLHHGSPEVAAASGGSAEAVPTRTPRQPLAERAVPQRLVPQVSQADAVKLRPLDLGKPPSGPCYVARLLAASAVWPQVLGALGQAEAMPATQRPPPLHGGADGADLLWMQGAA